MASTPPTAADVAEANRHSMAWVQVKAPRLTLQIGNGDYALAAGDYCTIPRHLVNQMRIDQLIV